MPRTIPPPNKSVAKRRKGQTRFSDTDSREKIRERLREAHLKSLRENPLWLNEAKAFDHDLRLHPDRRSIAADLFQELAEYNPMTRRKIDQKILDVEVLLANLLDQPGKGGGWIFLSMSPNEWTKNRYRRTGQYMIQAVYLLERKGYIERRRGYNFPKQSRLTRILPTDKFLEKYPRRDFKVVSDSKELVQVKDKNDKLVDYRDTEWSRHVRDILERANAVNSLAAIQWDGDPLSTALHAVYRHKFIQHGFTENGRLHTWGHEHYQGIPASERLKITINGEPVVELDYSGMHPRLLYAKEGIQYKGDPYLPDDPRLRSLLPDDPRLRPLFRDFLKAVFQSLQNSGYKVKAMKSVSWNTIRKAPKKWAALGITWEHNSFRHLVRKLLRAHEPISKHLLNERTALRTMNQDSRIALHVVNYFAKRKIPILAVHDSFIVQRRHEEELRRIMGEAYKNETGGFTCPIHY